MTTPLPGPLPGPSTGLPIGIAGADLSHLPVGDEDQPHLEAALARRGMTGRHLRWDDPAADWAGCALVVIRSTWDYPGRLAEFLRWVDAVSASRPLLNPAATVHWNCDKLYLGRLADAGVPTVPTRYAEDAGQLAAGLAELTSSQVVVKPTVSAGSELTGRFERSDPAAAQLAEQIWRTGRTAIVQPFVESVAAGGELALLHLDGRFSHAVRKGPLLAEGGGLIGGSYQEVITPATPTDAELACAEAVLDAYARVSGVSEPLLYSRVDLVTGDDGAPLLLELELIEPSLFLPVAPAAADRLASAIERRLG